jgi:hypothetical protein
VDDAYVLNEMCKKIPQVPLPNKEQLQRELQSRGDLRVYEEVIPAVESLIYVCRSTGGAPSRRLLDYAANNLDDETNRVFQEVAEAVPGLAQLELRHVEAWHDLLEATVATEALKHIPLQQKLNEETCKQLKEYLEGVDDLPALADVLRRIAMRRMEEMKACEAIGDQPLKYSLEPGFVRPSASVAKAIESFPNKILIKHVVSAFNFVNERFERQQFKIHPETQPIECEVRRSQPAKRQPRY